jgi:Protein kinase domain/TIR domain
MNIMRVGHKMKLIDLDASACFTEGNQYAASKFSSGFVPPELVYHDQHVACVKSSSILGKSGHSSDDSDSETDDGDEFNIHGGVGIGVGVGVGWNAPDISMSKLKGHEGEAGTESSNERKESPPSASGINSGRRDWMANVTFDLVGANPAQDIWALGVVFYHIACNVPLFLCDGDGNIGETDLRQLAEWSDHMKNEKLSRIKNPLARNLISIMLSKDPSKRPSIDKVLNHSFLAVKKANSVIATDSNPTAEYDIFLSYRVDTDFNHAKRMYEQLTAVGVKVWWDQKCLEPGEPWGIGFCRGMTKSRIFMPLLSRGSLKSIGELQKSSRCDNLYLEFMLALELKERGTLEKILPIFIGDYDSSGMYYKYTFRGVDPCHPESFNDVVVDSVQQIFRDRLEELALGMPILESLMVSEVMANLLKYQGCFIEGALVNSIDTLIRTHLQVLLKLSPQKLPPSVSSGALAAMISANFKRDDGNDDDNNGSSKGKSTSEKAQRNTGLRSSFNAATMTRANATGNTAMATVPEISFRRNGTLITNTKMATVGIPPQSPRQAATNVAAAPPSKSPRLVSLCNSGGSPGSAATVDSTAGGGPSGLETITEKPKLAHHPSLSHSKSVSSANWARRATTSLIPDMSKLMGGSSNSRRITQVAAGGLDPSEMSMRTRPKPEMIRTPSVRVGAGEAAPSSFRLIPGGMLSRGLSTNAAAAFKGSFRIGGTSLRIGGGGGAAAAGGGGAHAEKSYRVADDKSSRRIANVKDAAVTSIRLA